MEDLGIDRRQLSLAFVCTVLFMTQLYEVYIESECVKRRILAHLEEQSVAMTEARRVIQQLSLGLTRQAGRLVTADKADDEVRKADFNDLQSSLHSSCRVWPQAFHIKLCPHPLLVSRASFRESFQSSREDGE